MNYQGQYVPRTMRGLALLEAALALLLLALLVSAVTILASSLTESNNPETTGISNTQSELAMVSTETRNGRSLKKLGPTEYQIELLKQANEDYTRKTGMPAPKVMETKTEFVKELEAQTKTHIKPVLNNVKSDSSATRVEAKAHVEPPKKKKTQLNTTWTATTTGKHVKISIQTGDSYAVINWGDGGRDNVYANGSFSGNHTYSTDGSYTLTVEGEEFTIIEHSDNLQTK